MLNTAGYRFNQTDLNNRKQFTLRIDYSLQQRQQLRGVSATSGNLDDRTDIDVISPDRPLVYTYSEQHRFAMAWRWVRLIVHTTNCATAAISRRSQFISDWDYSTGVLYNTALGITNPMAALARRHGVPAPGPLDRHLPVQRQRLVLKGTHAVADRRQLAAQPRQSRITSPASSR